MTREVYHTSYIVCLSIQFVITQTVQENVYEALSPYQAPASKQESLYAQMRTYNIVNIPRENLE